MKKNLIGAVAAGLALALAFTGCESGEDTAFNLANYTEEAVKSKAKFVYVNAPSIYTSQDHAGMTLDVNTEYATGGVGSWTWSSYEKGENKWNRDVAKDSETVSYTSKRGEVTGKAVGDVVKTKKNTFTVDTSDNTWTLVQESTNKEVFSVYVWDYKTTTVGSTTTYAGPKEEYLYASRKQVPFKMQVNGTNTVALGTPTFVATEGSATTQSSVTAGLVYYGGTGGVAEDVARDTAIEQLKKAVEGQEKYVTRLKDNPDANKNDITTAEATLKTIKAYYDNARAWREGATYVVDESTTVDGVTNGSVKYYTAADGKVVYEITTKDSGTKKTTSGTYKLLSGTYLTGQLLLTKVDKVTFDTDAENKGFYVDAGNNNDRGKTEEDYPVASLSKAGSDLQYKGRVVKIAAGVLSGNEAVINCALNNAASKWYTRTNKLGWDYQTYKAAQDDRDTTGREYTDRNMTLQTYTLKQ